jgi:hypothetical protein
MKKTVLLIVGFLSLAGFANAQVVADFETPGSLGIFVDAQWGIITDSIYQVADPTGESSGVMAISFNLQGTSGHNAIQLATPPRTNFATNDAHVLSYSIYIPGEINIPDSLTFGLWAQSSVGWEWNERYLYAIDIPKDVWYPVYYFLLDSTLASPATDNNAVLGDCGIQWNSYGVDSGTVWSGIIYIDNVSLVGAEPDVVADFETPGSIGIFTDAQWGIITDSIYQAADPTGESSGAMAVSFNLQGTSGHNAIQLATPPRTNFATNDAHLLSYSIYIPSEINIPDSLVFGLWAQSSVGWEWNERYLYAIDIPKDVWYPVYYFLLDSTLASPATDNNAILGDCGIQWNSYGVDSGTVWSGIIYIDNVSLLGLETGGGGPSGPEWIVTSFDVADAGVEGFALTGLAGSSLSRVADPLPATTGDGALRVNFNFTNGDTGYVYKDNIMLYNADGNLTAHTITLDIYPHALFPAATFTFIITGAAAGDAWVEVPVFVDNGEWNTVIVDVAALISGGQVDPTQPAQLGLQVVYDGTTQTVPIWLDNLTTWGTGAITGVDDDANLPIAFELYNNYPNPFNPATTIKYDIAKESKVSIKVYDILGKEVASLVNETKPAGRYSINFDASKFASGMYIYKITAGSFVKSHKMMLLK